MSFGGGGLFGRSMGSYGPQGPYGAFPTCGCSGCLLIVAGIIFVCAGGMRLIGW